jgi:putative transposase
VKLAFIARQRKEGTSDSVRLMCEWLGVSRSGFYAASTRKPSRRWLANQTLKLQIRSVHERSRHRYGAPRVHAELRYQGMSCGHNRVARLMRDDGLRGAKRRCFKVTTLSGHKKAVSANILSRNFSTLNRELNTVWSADITYLRTREGWLYLAALIDLASRRVVGWSIDSMLGETLTLEALRMALATRQFGEGRSILHHSDRGAQYASGAYQAALAERGMTSSMSRKGDCWDNAVSESFFATLKTEVSSEASWQSRSQARREIAEYMNWYNFSRRHSTLKYLTPAEYEMKMLRESSPAA